MKKVFCLTNIVLFSTMTFSQWSITENTIFSRWAKGVTPDNVWQEYPRPQLVRSDWQNLNGLWDYAILPRISSAPSAYHGQILVPFCIESALSGVKKEIRPEDRIWYRRTFEIPASWAGKRVILNFEAVDWEAAVWVNDAYVGSHQGAYDRFSFDITDYLKEKSLQELKVSVWDPTNFGTQSRGKQRIPQEGIWYTPVSGIWQPVWLESVPEIYIKEIRIIPNVDVGKVTILPILSKPVREGYEVDITIYEGQRPIGQGKSKADQTKDIVINNPVLWSPDNPFLYDLKLELVKVPSERIEIITSYFGMRKISLGDGPCGKELFLNNKPLFHYGTLDQGWWPDGLYTPPSDEAMKYDLHVTKDMGFNMIRKHNKVEPDRWYYWCDKLGILVWQDMPSAMVAIPHPDNKRLDNPQYISRGEQDLERRSQDAAQFELELRRMIDLHYNAPSIVMWVPFNEGWGQYDTCRVSAWMKAYDPTRLVNAISGWSLRPCGDVYDIHTYQKDLLIPEIQKDRATVIGEFGGIGYPIEGHLWNPQIRNWGYQTYQSADQLLENYVYKFNQIVEMKKLGVSGAVYTQTTDVEGEVNGLMTYDRSVIKIESQKLKQIHAVLYDGNKSR